MNYIGDFAEDSTIRIVLSTNNASGAAVAPSSAFEADDFRIYKNGSASQKTTTNGVTITSPFDSVTGLHTLEIDTSNDTGDSGFWTTGADYWVIAVPDETVDSQTVVQVIAVFSIENRLRVKQTDQVSLASTATCTKLTDIETDTQDIQSRLPSALVSGRMDSSVGVMAANTITASAVASDAVTEIQSGLATSTGVTTAFTEIKGTGWSSSTDTLEKIRDASGGGSSSVTVAPLQATAPNRVSGTEIVTYINDTSSIGPIVVTDGNGDAVDLSSYTLKISVERIASGTIDANITPTVSGAENNQVTFTPTSDCVNSTTPRKWSLRSTSDGQVFAFGVFTVEWPARLS